MHCRRSLPQMLRHEVYRYVFIFLSTHFLHSCLLSLSPLSLLSLSFTLFQTYIYGCLRDARQVYEDTKERTAGLQVQQQKIRLELDILTSRRKELEVRQDE